MLLDMAADQFEVLDLWNEHFVKAERLLGKLGTNQRRTLDVLQLAVALGLNGQG
jgi:hypothetical protein